MQDMNLQLDMHNRLGGLGSDRVSVMLGVGGKLSKFLKDKVPFLVSHHCISHQLALACRQSANDIPYLQKLKSVLDQVIDFTVIQLFVQQVCFLFRRC